MTNSKQGGIGSTGLTYIEEKKMEAKLGRQLQKEVHSRPASWGTFVQHRVTNVLLDTGCKPTKDVRRVHPTISNWSGAEDYLRHDAIGEIKCFELKKFCQAHEAASFGYDSLRDECPEIFWQLVSNAILLGMNKAELCLYVPYQKELNAIREEAKESNDPNVNWLAYNTNDDELPYLLDGGHYKNLSLFMFDIQEADKKLLTSRVVIAIKLLQP